MDLSKAFKEHTTSEERTITPFHHIDPGFINTRKLFSVFGAPFIHVYDQHADKSDDHLARVRNNHLLVDMSMELCAEKSIRSISAAVADTPVVGEFVCGTEELEGNNDVHTEKRCSNRVLLKFETDYEVYIEYSTEHVYASTTESELAQGTTNSIFGEIRSIKENRIVIHPLIIGAPTYDHPKNGTDNFKLSFCGNQQYEIFPEDIKEFELIRDVEVNDPGEWQQIMKNLSESEVKEKIAEILGDTTKKDWGGEMHDHYSSHITLSQKRKSGAFLLKGPAKFEEMQPRHLGKNADQIFRLAMSTASVLVVQHCHDIGEAVRGTLRAFSVLPHQPRHYCLIDGRDTYRLLKAYGKI